MKTQKCTRCGTRGPCAMAGPGGALVCVRCLYEDEVRSVMDPSLTWERDDGVAVTQEELETLAAVITTARLRDRTDAKEAS